MQDMISDQVASWGMFVCCAVLFLGWVYTQWCLFKEISRSNHWRLRAEALERTRTETARDSRGRFTRKSA